MNPLLHDFSYLSASAAGALLSAIWQGAALVACVAICLRVLPGLSAAARSVVWLNVFVLLALLHVVPLFLSGAPGFEPAHAGRVHIDLRWSIAIVGLWFALSLLRAVQLVLGALHLRGVAKRAIPVPTDPELQQLLADAPGGRSARLCTSDEVARPSVLGFFRPRVLIPPALVDALSPQELHQVVLHEMEHLRRADDWTNLLQKIGLVLFPLNPALLWVERRLCAERELACDDCVVRSSVGRKAYALCLAHLAEFSILRRSFSLVLGAWERRPELVRRVHRILQQPARTMRRKPAMIATGGILTGALACAIALVHSPQFVTFVPATSALQHAQASALPDARELARELGGSPQLIRATVPNPAVSASTQKQQGPSPARRCNAVMRRTKNHPVNPQGRIATATPPMNLPNAEERLVVLTEWTTLESPPRVVLAVSPGQRALPAMAIPASYAVVRTPTGWLIIQI